MADGMTNQFLRSMGLGLGIGMALMTIVTIVTLPASYMMNKLIYHHPIMRVMAGFIAASFNIFVFPLVLIMVISGNWPKLRYFGLWPTIQTAGPSSYTGWLAPIFAFTNIVFHPFMMLYTDSAEDKLGYEKAMSGILLAKDSKGVVNEELFAEARKAGAIGNYSEWAATVNGLSADFEVMFNGEKVVDPPAQLETVLVSTPLEQQTNPVS